MKKNKIVNFWFPRFCLLFSGAMALFGAISEFQNKNYTVAWMIFGTGLLLISLSLRNCIYRVCSRKQYVVIIAFLYFLIGAIFLLGAFFSLQNVYFTGFALLCFLGLLCIFHGIDGMRVRELTFVISETTLIEVKIKALFLGTTPHRHTWRGVLKKTQIPDSVTAIGDEVFAFSACLQTVVIPNSVNSIGKGAFACCNSLEGVTVPPSVKNISENTFEGSDKIQLRVGKNSYAHQYAIKNEINYIVEKID